MRVRDLESFNFQATLDPSVEQDPRGPGSRMGVSSRTLLCGKAGLM